jgi:hypothetical protein
MRWPKRVPATASNPTTRTVEGSYPKSADGRARDPQAEAWCQAKRDDKDASYTASQRESNHVAHHGGGTRSPQVLTALLGLTALSGVTEDKFYGN